MAGAAPPVGSLAKDDFHLVAAPHDFDVSLNQGRSYVEKILFDFVLV
jgi:hypothetical protein